MPSPVAFSTTRPLTLALASASLGVGSGACGETTEAGGTSPTALAEGVPTGGATGCGVGCGVGLGVGCGVGCGAGFGVSVADGACACADAGGSCGADQTADGMPISSGRRPLEIVRARRCVRFFHAMCMRATLFGSKYRHQESIAWGKSVTRLCQLGDIPIVSTAQQLGLCQRGNKRA